MVDAEVILRELHHRVKNNFQIIASLMSLQKRLLPPDRRDDLRFIEEHVQAMAVAYRVVYATHDLIEVSIRELVREILDSLQQIAGPTRNAVTFDLVGKDHKIGLNQAIALSLYLAVMVPPQLDQAAALRAQVAIRLELSDRRVVLSIRGDWPEPVAIDAFRNRLANAYIRQLNAETIESEHPVDITVSFPLEPPTTRLG